MCEILGLSSFSVKRSYPPSGYRDRGREKGSEGGRREKGMGKYCRKGRAKDGEWVETEREEVSM